METNSSGEELVVKVMCGLWIGIKKIHFSGLEIRSSIWLYIYFLFFYFYFCVCCIADKEAIYDHEAAGEVDWGGAQQVCWGSETLWQGLAAHRRL